MKTVSERKEFEEVGGYSPRPRLKSNNLNANSSNSSASSSGNSEPPNPDNALNHKQSGEGGTTGIELSFSPRPSSVEKQV